MSSDIARGVIAKLKKDKERLDWLEEQKWALYHSAGGSIPRINIHHDPGWVLSNMGNPLWSGRFRGKTARAAIDEAMKTFKQDEPKRNTAHRRRRK
jgi:hypothetical protein